MNINNKFHKVLCVLVSVFIGVSVVGCSKNIEKQPELQLDSLEDISFDEITEQAKGTTVNFYGWGGDERINAWVDDVFAPKMKEKYDIKVNRVSMDIDQILNKLYAENQTGKKEGTVDMIWLNGENFFSAKENNLLYGSFTQALPNFEKYVDVLSNDTLYDFAYPIDGYECPYGKAQLVLINDSSKTSEMPANTQEFMEFAKKYKGQVTYPAPPDFTGSAFIRNIIYEFVSPEVFMNMKPDKQIVKKAIQPALDYLKQLNTYLWKEGKNFPATASQQQNMYMDGELVFHLSYESYSIATAIEKGMYTDTSRSFLFDKGTIGNTNFIAIAKNSPNKAGALVAINEIITPEMQSSRYDVLKALPALGYNKLSDKEKEMFDSVDIGKGTIPQNILMGKRLPEMPAKLVPIIEEIWLEEVVAH